MFLPQPTPRRTATSRGPRIRAVGLHDQREAPRGSIIPHSGRPLVQARSKPTPCLAGAEHLRFQLAKEILADQDSFSWNQIETWLQDMFDLSKWFLTVREKANMPGI